MSVDLSNSIAWVGGLLVGYRLLIVNVD
jgi:hypothetical protein